ncbi:recombinase family protein [Clostridium perfringens]|uniref:recombinase family protein n=1 Tax=Clostridium perfringens TaxID=1502 RepID=UPI0022487005|nr:recombinase family protein [Clostridium perfringens]MCX0368449.1 recombinase family protein [Clostridium perfringens]
MIYGYVRCSTDETKQNIDRQIRDIKLLANEKINYIYKEFESGTKIDREELNKLLKVVGEGDTIVATEVSRISRSTKQLCEIIELAKDRKLKLILGAFIVDCTKELDPMTEGMLKMMGVFSEMERNMISQRVKSGIANARAKGKQIGRKETTVEDIPLIFIKHYPKLKQREINKSEFSRLTNLSRPTINKYIKILEGEKNS